MQPVRETGVRGFWCNSKVEKMSTHCHPSTTAIKRILTTTWSLLLVGLLLMPIAAFAQTSVVFDSPGATQFDVPATITKITVEAWGAGGRGSARTTGNNVALAGGGGGAYSRSEFTVTPGDTFDLYVGAGATNTSAGGDSWFGSVSTVMAKGGGSVANNSNTPGAGGLASAGVGTVKFNGGTGALGTGGSFGGGGGSSGGTAAAGVYPDGTTTVRTGGTAPAGGGDGGAGAASGVVGQEGAAPGGGGGGGYRAGSGTTQAPGNGAPGRVVVTYDCAISSVTFDAVADPDDEVYRCAAAETETYTVTAPGATTLTYSLDAASLAGGNTIDSATGTVTWDAAWVGFSTVTVEASSSGCALTANLLVHTVALVQAPVFDAGSTVQRCRAAESIVYSATAHHADTLVYSLDAASLAGGNTIDSATGEVTFVATWSGTSTVTATATGCGTTKTADLTVLTGALFANDDYVVTLQGNLAHFNVLDNDLCNIDASSVTLISSPIGGFVQVGAGGEMTYVSFGAFEGLDQFTYQVCTPAPVQCKQATVYIQVNPALDDPCYVANKASLFYLPYPENETHLRQSLLSAGSQAMSGGSNGGTDVRTVVSILVPYPGTRIVYDHWEDGYEADSNFPVQSTTEVWGDGDLTNGVAPGYPTDFIPGGGYLIIDNTFPWNRSIVTIVPDGKDKISSSSSIIVSKVSGDAARFAVQNVKTNVSEESYAGQHFVLPFGENVTDGGTSAFRYTGMFVRAYENGTVVELDYNGDGTNDVTSPTLDEGDVWFYQGTASSPGVAGDVNNSNDIKAGARVTASKDVSVDLVFGGIDNYGTRNIAIYPSNYYGDKYYSPVYSTNTDALAYAFCASPHF